MHGDPEVINNLLPQTQCQLCGFAGCKPYAQALVDKKADPDRCAPGGLKTLHQLSKTLKFDPKPWEKSVQARSTPDRLAAIDPQACIGCGKCLPVCPTDAIVGDIKALHAVIESECTGCGRCLPACPADCIDLNPTGKTPQITPSQTTYLKQRYQEHLQRFPVQKPKMPKISLSRRKQAIELAKAKNRQPPHINE
jgi:Na+-translocating ferredoxin:NAD+ oxidoreductase subunit B